MSLLFAFAALAAAQAPAAVPAPPPPPAEAKTADDQKKICKREEVIGSRVSGKRVCRTKAQWDAIQAQDQRAVQEMNRLNPGARSN